MLFGGYGTFKCMVGEKDLQALKYYFFPKIVKGTSFIDKDILINLLHQKKFRYFFFKIFVIP